MEEASQLHNVVEAAQRGRRLSLSVSIVEVAVQENKARNM